MASPKIVIPLQLAPPSLDTLNRVIQTYEGRDKAVRLFQFASRLVVGITAEATGRHMRQLHIHSRELMTSLAAARRAFRCGRELPILLAIPQSVLLPCWSDVVLDLSAKLSLLLFFLNDHIGWWHQVTHGLARGRHRIRSGLKFLTLSSLIMAVYSTKCLLNSFQSQKEEHGQRKSEQQKYMLGIIRHVCWQFRWHTYPKSEKALMLLSVC